MINLRFLNTEDTVDDTFYEHQAEHFKKTLEALHHSDDVADVAKITQEYFKDEFGMPVHSIELIVCNDPNFQSIHTRALEEFFGSTQEKKTNNVAMVHAKGILVKDEIAFSNFYQASHHTEQMLLLMEQLEVDVFIPIFERSILVAYIKVAYNARAGRFFVRNEQAQMVVFSKCVGSVLKLLHKKHLENILHENNMLKEELYEKHQHINQYKESVRSFLHDTAQRKIGLVLYKNGQFHLLNPQAHELIDIDLNRDAGHVLSLEMKKMIDRLERFSSAQNSVITLPGATQFVINANFYGQKSTIIFTFSMPEVADIIKPYVDALADPSEWDYLLYLQTTASGGQLINQLLPGTTQVLINIKVELLKMALNTKALLVEADEQDKLHLIEIIHHISLKEHLMIIDLKEHVHAHQQGALLFGIAALDTQTPLLKQLHTSGTLFIDNIHLLALEHQNKLADCIRYGYYTTLFGSTKNIALVRIVCSSPLDLSVLVKQGIFSALLFKQLRVSVFKLPYLSSLPKQDIISLIAGYSVQALADPSISKLTNLSENEQDRLIANSPPSITAFKERVKNIVLSKTQKSDAASVDPINPSYHHVDPMLAKAVRLGKTSLKDKSIMHYLWKKFENQNKIASLLGVNRSSVNRRCKKFGLE